MKIFLGTIAVALICLGLAGLIGDGIGCQPGESLDSPQFTESQVLDFVASRVTAEPGGGRYVWGATYQGNGIWSVHVTFSKIVGWGWDSVYHPVVTDHTVIYHFDEKTRSLIGR